MSSAAVLPLPNMSCVCLTLLSCKVVASNRSVRGQLGSGVIYMPNGILCTPCIYGLFSTFCESCWSTMHSPSTAEAFEHEYRVIRFAYMDSRQESTDILVVVFTITTFGTHYVRHSLLATQYLSYLHH